MELFKNLIYEHKKGMRDLALYTCKKEKIKYFEKLLHLTKTNYKIMHLPPNKYNIFFGNKECLNILENFSSENLNKLTPQEDFILGIMLGYSRNEQYARFLKKINHTVTFCKNTEKISSK